MPAAAPELGPAETVPVGLAGVRARLKESETARAAGLAGAMIATNVVALALTVAFGRILGRSGYGEVAALLSAFLILSVPGQALQLATARAGSLGQLGGPDALRTTLGRWTRRLALLAVVLAAVGALAREPLAHVIGVDAAWGAAAVLPTGALWFLLSVQRGVLQAVRAYRAVGVSLVLEQVARLAIGVPLALGGLDATGAFLGSPGSMLVMAIALDRSLAERLGPGLRRLDVRRLRDHVRVAGVPILALALVAVLQNIDVIVAQHRLPKAAAGSYAAAAVAAKVVIWVAVGLGFHLVPEAARRAATGLDSRGVLARALGLIAAVVVPCLLLFAFAAELVLRVGFGSQYVDGAEALLVLGAAMSLLSACYLAVQFLLALHRTRFLVLLGAVALAEPVLLAFVASDESQAAFAGVVLAVQAAAAALMLVVALTRRSVPPPLAQSPPNWADAPSALPVGAPRA